MCILEVNQDPAQRLHYCFWTSPPSLCIAPLPGPQVFERLSAQEPAGSCSVSYLPLCFLSHPVLFIKSFPIYSSVFASQRTWAYTQLVLCSYLTLTKKKKIFKNLGKSPDSPSRQDCQRSWAGLEVIPQVDKAVLVSWITGKGEWPSQGRDTIPCLQRWAKAGGGSQGGPRVVFLPPPNSLTCRAELVE